MKIASDFNQSRVLKKILLPESADVCWTNHKFGNILSSWRIESTSPTEYKNLLDYYHVQGYLIEPAWSLTALLEQIPSDIGSMTLTIEKCDSEPFKYGLNYHDRWGREDDIQTKYYDDLVDACYEMIIKIHEQKIL